MGNNEPNKQDATLKKTEHREKTTGPRVTHHQRSKIEVVRVLGQG